MKKLFLSILAGALLLANLPAQTQNQKNQSIVYFTKDVSSATDFP